VSLPEVPGAESGAGRGGTHRALDAAAATAGLLERAIGELEAKGENTLRSLHPVRGDFTWPDGDVHRRLRERLLDAIEEKQPLELVLYNKDEFFYYRRTLLPLSLDAGRLFGAAPDEKSETAIPLYNIISATAPGL
jgi:DNA polymerase III epsilon subunit-like protein